MTIYTLSNITELRLILALAVLISHTIQLAEFNHYDIWRKILSSELAVQGFFILSGYLVMSSYHRSSSLKDFYFRRILRIYPGYFVAVIFFAIIGVFQAVLLKYVVSWAEIVGYFSANLTLMNFLQPGISGVFFDNAYTDINGALWTIKLEVMFYALVPLIYFIGNKLSLQAVAMGMFLIGLTWRQMLMIFEVAGYSWHPSLVHQLPGQLHFFAIGVLLFDTVLSPKRLNSNAVIFSIVVLLALMLHGITLAAHIFGMTALIYIITRLPQVKMPFSRIDLSYGIYLCHFPIIQILIAAGFSAIRPIFFLLIVFFSSVFYAVMSWLIVESPALRFAKEK